MYTIAPAASVQRKLPDELVECFERRRSDPAACRRGCLRKRTCTECKQDENRYKM